MLNSIAKWYISRKLDCGASLPKWVERRIQRDASLRQFERQACMLASRLQSTPALLAGDEASCREVLPSVPKQTSFMRRSVAVLSLAAVLLLMLVPFFTPDRDAEVEIADVVPPVQTLEASELALVVDSTSDLLSAMNKHALSVADPLAARFEEAEQLAALLDTSPEELSDRLIDRVIAPTNELGARYGQFLSEVDNQIATDNRQMLSNGVAAWKSLLRSAPAFANWTTQ